MLIELDIFSGRPNPRWRLDGHTSRRLLEVQERMKIRPGDPPQIPGLGYRGFLYTVEHVTWRAWGRALLGPTVVLADPERAIEGLLLSTLPPEYASLRPRIAARDQ